MLSTIQLDNHLFFKAYEVHNVSSYRLLSAKLISDESMGTKLLP